MQPSDLTSSRCLRRLGRLLCEHRDVVGVNLPRRDVYEAPIAAFAMPLKEILLNLLDVLAYIAGAGV
jgi:hypothetical protein